MRRSSVFQGGCFRVQVCFSWYCNVRSGVSPLQMCSSLVGWFLVALVLKLLRCLHVQIEAGGVKCKSNAIDTGTVRIAVCLEALKLQQL